MTSGVKYCHLECNWVAIKNQSIEDIVIYQNEFTNDSSEMENGAVHPEGCSMEKMDCVDNDCQLTITTRPPQYNFQVSAVDILCSAKHLEIYTSSNEYLETSRGIMMQELDDDTRLYCLQYSFKRSQAACKLKLKSLQTPDRVWFHSIYVTLVRGRQESAQNHLAATLGGQAFDMDKVKSMIGEAQLSIGAQQLMATLEAQKPRESASPVANLGVIMQLFSQMQTAPRPQTATRALDHGQSQAQCQIGQGQGQTEDKAENQSQAQAQQTDDFYKRDQRQQQTVDSVQCSAAGLSSSPTAHAEQSMAKANSQNREQDHRIERILKSQLETMEKRMMENVAKLINQSEERLCVRIAEMLNVKTQGDSLGLD